MSGGVALVTGSCRRLGAHIAARLADAGHAIALHAGHDPHPEPWLEARLEPVERALFVADLDDARAVGTLLDRVAQRFGRPVEVLVNSASRFAALEGGADYADIDAHLRTNMTAPVALASAMEAGAVVNILDQRIVHPPRDQLAYTLSKQALAEATRTLAGALAPRVRVNAVAPGLTLPTDDYHPGQMERLAAMMPLGRLPAPEEIADAVAWLVAARSVTGQTIFVDGGAHLRHYERDFVHLGR